MNTRISYMYRDASNSKAYGDVVVWGTVTEEDLQPYLQDGEFFIPELVGMPPLREELYDYTDGVPNEDDHSFHTLENFEPTKDSSTIDVTAINLIDKFQEAHAKGWPVLDL